MTVPQPAPRRQVLRDATLDATLHDDGYAITPMLDAAEVRALLDAYAALVPDGDAGLVIDFMRPERTVLKAVAELLAPLWERHIPELFVGHRIVVATFVTKHPGPDSAMLLHDEPSFVDERSFRSHALWIPLVDVGPDLDNGHLLVMPGSDRLERGLAGYNTPIQYRPYESQLLGRMTPVTARAGDAVVYDSRTLHASVPNRSAELRPAIAASFAPLDAPLVHVVATGRRRRRVHGVPDDFYLTHHPFDIDPMALPYPVVDEFDDDVVIDPDHLAKLVGLGSAAELAPPDVELPADLEALVGRPAPEDFARLEPVDRGPGGADRWVPDAEIAVGDRPGADDYPQTVWSSGAGLATLARPTPDASTVVVQPQGRYRFRCGGAPDVHHVLEVVECPLVDSGAAAAGRAARLELGDRLLLRGDDEVTLWNSGVAQLIVTLAPQGATAS